MALGGGYPGGSPRNLWASKNTVWQLHLFGCIMAFVAMFCTCVHVDFGGQCEEFQGIRAAASRACCLRVNKGQVHIQNDNGDVNVEWCRWVMPRIHPY